MQRQLSLVECLLSQGLTNYLSVLIRILHLYNGVCHSGIYS